VQLDIGGGIIITSSITNEAVDDLRLVVGGKASAVIKSSDVMIAVDLISSVFPPPLTAGHIGSISITETGGRIRPPPSGARSVPYLHTRGD
jgi:hypothetical protein